jgi:Flp pilus assembly protein TadB
VISPLKNHKRPVKPRARARAERARRQLRDDWVDQQRRQAAEVHQVALLILLLAGAFLAVAIGHVWLGIP